MSFAEIAVDAPVGHNRTFTYSVPKGLDLRPGHFVRVPFGSRRMQGIVISLPEHSQITETRDVLGFVFEDEVLNETSLSLAQWISEYYMCSRFEAAAAMLPPGGRTRPRTHYVPKEGQETIGIEELNCLQTRIVGYLNSHGRISEDKLVHLFGVAARASAKALVSRGLLDRAYGSLEPTVRTLQRKFVSILPESASRGYEMVSFLESRSPKQASLLRSLLDGKIPILLATANKEFGSSAVNRLVERGMIHKTEKSVDRDPLQGKIFPPALPFDLTDAQAIAASSIREAMDSSESGFKYFLLNGVTGSGKTEVYLDATEHCLAVGKRVIVMVPEIALTHQTIERFAVRFPGKVAILHSGLSQGQRFDQWWRIRGGEYPIVIGSRSAVFAPQPDLGLIVMDEEHEWTYKQHDVDPRYHARDVMRKLAAITGATVVAGSASPDVCSYHTVASGRSRLLSLPKRVRNAASDPGVSGLAAVSIVDMRKELREGNRLIFSRALMKKMGDTLDAGEQMILFLNRRGSATYLQCRNCGLGLRCRRCDVGLTFHHGPPRLVCHWCGERRRPPPKCPRCASVRLSYYGIGTQAVVDEVIKHFPMAKVLRWDRDSTKSRGMDENILERFRTRQAQVLVGTQMIAKGLHFPSVTLVGVIMADLGINAPDYRAGERTFQVLCQVSGRAGRGLGDGEVVVQTYQPENYAIKAAASQDYDFFYPQEITFRREQNNPPFSRLIRLLYSHTSRATAESEAFRWSTLIKLESDGWGFSNVEILGPTPAHPQRLRGRYRWQIILRGSNPRVLLDKLTIPNSWTVDVDPVGSS